ncbi:TagA domain-containing protein [Escherichia coli]|uniref:TagA domain-containing protein n=1 Tax=Enterobacteriaceae TaxID=543 RepID=UPI0023004F96|nr:MULTISPECIES: TagA domain-containing protein [Enterobacteriaceae]MEC6668730.1 TagA domain-containing protein [Escherichia coli]HCN5427696.1 hypothetical protein [Escherichia coli]
MDTREARKPEQFGIPVTTLMEYYDPQGILSSYIYPAFYTKHVSMMEYGKVN